MKRVHFLYQPPGLSKTGEKGERTPLSSLLKHALPVVHALATPDEDGKILSLNVASLQINSAQAFIHMPAEVKGSWGMGVVDCI